MPSIDQYVPVTRANASLLELVRKVYDQDHLGHRRHVYEKLSAMLTPSV